MSDLRSLKSARGGSRARGVQGRLSISFGEDDPGDSRRAEPARSARSARPRRPARPAPPRPVKRDEPPRPAPIFHPLAYRSVLAGWPIEHRERWGLRANELEETGLSWRDAETQAFVEAWNGIREREARAATNAEVVTG
ncbi:hypothetical protein OJF2_33000 [Aquisphaera giovannonii]|uniref:Uncharacterized protein n=1 Tax=Aquisphaera giovannonii TaxID=406548 RepID=A0A5B9W2G4_9BACT|nr:hypothetical protein [Aquisphaera giovannonii]QEH34758.1 hypothetical protein OJF2_33000 [Aquisphaera giovannonii]